MCKQPNSHLPVNPFLILVALILFCTSAYSQTKDIRWLSQFPPALNDKKQKSLAKRITEFVVGKKEEIQLIKPMAVFASNPDTFLLLDQGIGALLEVQGKKIEYPHSLRKKFINMNSLIGICETPGRAILFTDSKRNKIFEISTDRKELVSLNDSLQLQQPTGIAWSTLNNEIWVVETAAHRIAILDKQGKRIKTIGKRGTGPGEFNFPTYLTIDKDGNAYVIDAMNFRVQIFNKAGDFISAFGESGDASGYFSRPKGIALDSYGNIYVVDALFHTVQIFDHSGKFLFRFGEQGQGKEEFWMPTGIFIDKNNYIYISDSYNARVQIFKLVD
ncbi:MAG: 6-bladed beta-propeller [Bacteroidota bacterium]